MPIKTALQNVPFLEGLTDEQLAQLIDTGRVDRVPGSQVIFNAGDTADCLFIILAGQVKVYLYDPHGNEIVVTLLGVGDYFGEMALLDGGVRSANVASLSDCELFVLERQAFLDLLGLTPQLLTKQFSELSRRLRDANQRFLYEQMTQQLMRAEMEADRRRALAQLVAGVAHEVNTPLGIINTAASVIKNELQSGPLHSLARDASAKRALADILEATELMEKNVTRAHTLIRSFKNLSVDQIADVRETMSLPEAVEEILALFGINARKAKLEMRFDNSLTADDSEWVGYRGHLSRILLNLLTNIERYAYPDGSGGKVDLSISAIHEEDQPCFCLVVRDFGEGITSADLPRVFEPFFTTGRGRGGTGLGLAMVYNLVTEALKGRITMESAPHQGTTVRITFPRVIAQ